MSEPGKKPAEIDPVKMRLRAKAVKTRRDCRTLYENGRPGWEFGTGWNDVVSKLSYRLECANRLFMREYGVHAVVDQAKEKFGGLRFYYTVHRDPPAPAKWLCEILRNSAEKILDNAEFKMKSVTVKPARETVVCSEIEPGGPDPYMSAGSKVLETEEKDFKCLFKTIHEYEIAKSVPTRNRLLYIIARACRRLGFWVSSLYPTDTNRQNIGVECLDDFVERSVRNAEDECYSTCEECGRTIGTDYSPRCQTTGWIAYLCEKCAKSRGFGYKKGDGLYDKDGNLIKQLDTEAEGRDEDTE